MSLKLLCSLWRMPSKWLIFCLVISSLSVFSQGETQPSLVINPMGENKTEPAGTGFVLFCTKGAGEADFTDYKWTNAALPRFRRCASENEGIICTKEWPYVQGSTVTLSST
uniref:Putative secreted protein synganglion overexpressed n=1 Tax=Rhipicephalus microplus TaxID=6941 RepID=A0A6M2DCR5_RHIMP